MKITEIRPYEANAKVHPDKQLKQIAASLREFGWRQPIVVDKAGVIIVGHGRYYAYLKHPEGIAEPRIEVADDLTDEQVRSYRLADNKLNESDWNMDLVKQDLIELGPDWHLYDLTGFSRDLILDTEDRDDIVPTNAPAIAKIGDVWLLGKNKVLCGDATKKEDVARLLGEIKADMVFTDPPYNIDYQGAGENTSNHIMSDNMSSEKFQEFLTETMKNYRETTKQGGGLYIFHSPKTQSQFEKAINDSGMTIKAQLIWNKPSAGLGMGDYRGKHEPFFYCGIDGKINFYGDRTNTDIWDFEPTDDNLAKWAKRQKRLERLGQTTIWTMKRESTSDYVHPTQKPVELIQHALINSSKHEDIVTDFFLGSGSTLIACQKLNRICYGMELDPKYIDIIIKRWEDYTGEKAEKVI